MENREPCKNSASYVFSFSSPWRYTVSVPTARTCQVSFTDSENIRHSVEVTASTLYEAAVLAMAEFSRCGFTGSVPGPATQLTVTVKMPTTSPEVQWSKIEVWLLSAGKPNEQAMKGRLRELLGFRIASVME